MDKAYGKEGEDDKAHDEAYNEGGWRASAARREGIVRPGPDDTIPALQLARISQRNCLGRGVVWRG